MSAAWWVVLTLCGAIPGVSLLAYAALAAVQDSRSSGYFSLESRARRAIRPGCVSGALKIYANARDEEALVYFLGRELPRWAVAGSLARAARELFALERAVLVARDNGVPMAITDRLTIATHEAQDTLWQTADRVATAAAQRVDSPALRVLLQHDAEKVEHLAATARSTREALAELTLAGADGGDLRRAELQLGALGGAARDLM